MGIDAELYFDNIQVEWAIQLAQLSEFPELSVCRILFRPSDLQQVPLRKLPAHLRALLKRGYYFDHNPRAYHVLSGSAAAAERRLSILVDKIRQMIPWMSVPWAAVPRSRTDSFV